jgi:hypothetical protein
VKFLLQLLDLVVKLQICSLLGPANFNQFFDFFLDFSELAEQRIDIQNQKPFL